MVRKSKRSLKRRNSKRKSVQKGGVSQLLPPELLGQIANQGDYNAYQAMINTSKYARQNTPFPINVFSNTNMKPLLTSNPQAILDWSENPHTLSINDAQVIFGWAIRNDNVDLVNRVLKKSPEMWEILVNDQNFIFIADYGSKKIFSKIMNIVKDKTFGPSYFIPKTFERAIRYGNLEMVKWMFSQYEKEIDLNSRQREDDGETYLSLAATERHLPIVKFLVEKGANVRADNDFALKEAAFQGDLDIILYLVSKGAPINEALNELILADRTRRQYKMEHIAALIDKGAKITKITMDLASRFGDVELVEYLRSRGGEIRPELMNAATSMQNFDR